MEINQAEQTNYQPLPESEAPAETHPSPTPDFAQESQPKSRKTLILVLVLLLLAAIGVAAYFAFQSQSLKSKANLVETENTQEEILQTPPVIADPTEGWEVYASDKISFKYPAGLYVLQEPRNQDDGTSAHFNLLLNEAIAHEYQTCLESSKNDENVDCYIGRVVYSISIATQPNTSYGSLSQKHERYENQEEAPFQIQNFTDSKQRAWVIEDPIWGQGDSSYLEADTSIGGNYFLINVKTHTRSLEKYLNQTMMLQDDTIYGTAYDATPMLNHLSEFARQILSTFEFTE